MPLRSPVNVCTFHAGSAQLLGVLHLIEEGQHLAKLAYRIGWNTLRDIFRIKSFQTLMGEVPYFHRLTVACSLTLVNTAVEEEAHSGTGQQPRFSLDLKT